MYICVEYLITTKKQEILFTGMASLGALTAISIVRYFTVVRPFNMGNLTNQGVVISIGKFVLIFRNVLFDPTCQSYLLTLIAA